MQFLFTKTNWLNLLPLILSKYSKQPLFLAISMWIVTITKGQAVTYHFAVYFWGTCIYQGTYNLKLHCYLVNKYSAIRSIIRLKTKIFTFRPQIFRLNILLWKKPLKFLPINQNIAFPDSFHCLPTLSVRYLHKVFKIFWKEYNNMGLFIFQFFIYLSKFENWYLYLFYNILIEGFEQGFAMITFQRWFNNVYSVKRTNAFQQTPFFVCKFHCKESRHCSMEKMGLAIIWIFVISTKNLFNRPSIKHHKRNNRMIDMRFCLGFKCFPGLPFFNDWGKMFCYAI